MVAMLETDASVHNLGSIELIPAGEGRTFQVGHLTVAVFRTRDNRLFATQAACPHRAGLLAEGIVGGGKVVCPLHSFKFDVATGQPVGNECEALKTYGARVNKAGEVLLEVGGEEVFPQSIEGEAVN